MKFTNTKKQPLLDALAEHLPDSSKSTLRQFIKHGRILVGDSVIDRANEEVNVGQVIEFSEKKSEARRCARDTF